MPLEQVFSGGGDEHDDTELTAGQVQSSVTNLDALLDEIDAVLETNAEAFVQGFVQKGGE